MSVITFDDVRMFLWDRTGKDNQITNKLVFSDPEIEAAMRFAAREYNSLPPIQMKVHWTALPADTNWPLDGIAMGLYIARQAQMSRNQIGYTAGGATVNFEKEQIAYMKEQIPMHDERFKLAAGTHKKACNYTGFIGLIDTIHVNDGYPGFDSPN